MLLPETFDGLEVLALRADSTCNVLATERRMFDFCTEVSEGCESFEVVCFLTALSEARTAVLGMEPELTLTFLDAPTPTAVLRSIVTDEAVGWIRLSPVLPEVVAAEGASTALGELAISALRRERRGFTGLLVGCAIDGGVGVGWVLRVEDFVTCSEAVFLRVGRSCSGRRSATEVLSRWVTGSVTSRGAVSEGELEVAVFVFLTGDFADVLGMLVDDRRMRAVDCDGVLDSEAEDSVFRRWADRLTLGADVEGSVEISGADADA